MLQKFLFNQRGFTLMEMVVASAVFVVVAVAITDIFIISSNAQRRTEGAQTVSSGARFVMETVEREARMGRINYDYYTNGEITSPTGTLALIDPYGYPVVFKTGGADSDCHNDGKSYPCLIAGIDVNLNDSIESNEWAPITPKGVKMPIIKFYIQPTRDPFNLNVSTGNYAADEQPRVTIVFATQNIPVKAVEQVTVNLQTTVSSRKYGR
ncbi:MAG: prepilin-type N-terminal cleavage/methylation domain-containing protein [Candidatus Kerfeldbacteria bacterium]|nr:prepilin-type N-terminal cleavage/methylation domain-containing protein [Candidatus Kerfeldbacteria bacterium]